MTYIEIQAMMPNVNWDRVAMNYAVLDCIKHKEYNIILEVDDGYNN